jgi:hypothetical protein
MPAPHVSETTLAVHLPRRISGNLALGPIAPGWNWHITSRLEDRCVGIYTKSVVLTSKLIHQACAVDFRGLRLDQL